MYEFEIRRKDDYKEIAYIQGYNLKDAFARHPELNGDEWEMTLVYFID